jgi:hypothetical protein
LEAATFHFFCSGETIEKREKESKSYGSQFPSFDAEEESICGDFMAKINGRPKFFYSKCQRSGLISHSCRAYFPSDVVPNSQ